MPRITVLLILTGFISGCAHLKIDQQNTTGHHHEQLVAIDLVNALMQLEGYHPTTTSLQMMSPESPFGKHLIKVLGQAGYAVQVVTQPEGKQYVAYSASIHEGTIDPGVTTYQVNIADVMLKRSYRYSGGVVKPNSDLYVIGVDSSKVRLNDQIFQIDQSLEVNHPALPHKPESTAQPKTFPVSAAPHPKPEKTGPAARLKMQLVNRPNAGNYRVGELIQLSVITAMDSQMNCYYRDGHGEVVRIFPNRYSPDNLLSAGEVIELPGSDRWHMEATKHEANDEIMCVAIPAENGRMPLASPEKDFESLPVASLEQIFDQYRSELGNHIVRDNLTVTVN